MKKNSTFLLIAVLLALTMTVTPVFAKNSATSRQRAESNPELTVPSLQTAEAAPLKTVSTPVKLDNNEIGEDSEIIFDKDGKGIYFLKKISVSYKTQYEIIFYDLKNQTYKSIYTTSALSYHLYYINNNAIYFLNSESKTQGNDGNEKNFCSITINKYDLEKRTNSSMDLEDIETSDFWFGYVECFGIDNQERIYVATGDKEILLFNNNGKYLSRATTSNWIEQFCGFDPVNGNFYYISDYNWVYWGFDHSMASMMAGNVNKNNVIKTKDTNMMILYQYSFYEHKNPITMLNGRYLAALSTFNNDIGILLDSNAYNYTDVTEKSTDIDLTTGNVSVSVINIANKNAVKMAFQTAASHYENGQDTSSIGTRCALNPAGTSLIIKTESNILTEYDIKTKKTKIQLQTKHPVYTFDMKGNQCIAVEKEGNNFYVENVDWVYPTDINIEHPDSLAVGSSYKITCTPDIDFFKLDYTYKSSTPSVISVDKNGKLNAFKSGTATITVQASPINVTKQFKITVKDTSLSSGNAIYKTSNIKQLTSSITHSSTTESDYGNTQTSYITPLKNGNYERIEYINKKIVREVYNSSFKLISKSNIPFELSIWGGYFSGQNYNFLLFGQKNSKESNKQEVYRIVQYDKNWKRLGSCSIKGANTYIPFEAGGADMTETNGKLYIHTCHTMYKSEDGYHHQSNCTFVMNESNRKVVDSYYDSMNISTGYVSHSFSQRIATDGRYIYRADLGDAFPRGIALTITDINSKVSEPLTYGSTIKISGQAGDNYTGFTLDALKISEDYYMLTGTGIKSGNPVKNIYINCGLKKKITSGATWITNYKKSDHIDVLCPKLVALNKTQFLLMWEEQNTKTDEYTTKMVLLNENGQKASDIYSSKIPLSKCDPVVNTKGMVSWYITTDETPILVEINPYQLAKVSSSTKNLTAFHQHKWGNGKFVKKPTYTAGGLKTYTCTICKLKKTKKVPPKPFPAAGTRYKISGNTYTVRKAGKEVTLSRVNTKAASFTIPKTVTAKGVTYKVTALGTRAFMNNTKIKTITVSTNITKISNTAFYYCSNLKTVKIKTLKLTKKRASAKAFTGANKKLVIKVPKKVKKSYKKIFKGLKVK